MDPVLFAVIVIEATLVLWVTVFAKDTPNKDIFISIEQSGVKV